jgi:hypothetical protein
MTRGEPLGSPRFLLVGEVTDYEHSSFSFTPELYPVDKSMKENR